MRYIDNYIVDTIFDSGHRLEIKYHTVLRALSMQVSNIEGAYPGDRKWVSKQVDKYLDRLGDFLSEKP